MLVHVDSDEAARRLAAELNSTARRKPCVVVSTPAQQQAPYIDAEAIFGEVGDLAEVYLIQSGPESWAFSRAMPERTQVYGGAGRVYPVGSAWVDDPYASPLRFAWSKADGVRATDQLVADALRMAADAGLLNRTVAQPVRVGGQVQAVFAPARAIVRTHARHLASVWQELLAPDVPIDRVLADGMRVDGLLDLDSKRYDVRRMLRAAEECLAPYAVGDVVLAEVAEVAAEHAVLRLHPDVAVRVSREEITSNDLDLVSSLMTQGEVLSARVTGTGPAWALSLLDVDDEEEPLPAPSLLPGGPAWLLPPALVPPQPEHVAEPVLAEPETNLALVAASVETAEPVAAPPIPVPPTPAVFDPARRAAAVREEAATLRRELDKARRANERGEAVRTGLLRSLEDLRRERQLLHAELERAKASNRRLDGQLRGSRADLRKARQKAERRDRNLTEPARFLDPEDQLRHEVLVAWAERIPAAEKADRPLPDFTIGPEFLRTLDEVEGVDRAKVVAVVVEVLTGLADEQEGRDMHQLRTGPAGDAPPLVREDGATCWRVALQRNTPQARRLHFWRGRGGEIELSRVGLHDDFRA